MSETILVTGAAGFIGSHLCQHLLSSQEYAVIGIDNFDPFYDRSVKLANLSQLNTVKAWRFEELDILDSTKLTTLLRETKPKMVVHLAARAGVRPSILDPQGYVEFNVRGTTNVLEACLASEVSHVLFASSSSVYGDNAPVPFSERQDVSRPISPYAATKAAGEVLCHTYHHVHQMSIACLRFFTVYGPRQRPDLAIHKFSRAILNGDPITKYGAGDTYRDYTFVDDIVKGVTACVEWIKAQKHPVYEIINLGNSNAVSLNELIEKLQAHLNIEAEIRQEPVPPGDVSRTYADISKAKSLLGWAPTTSIDEGLKSFVAWLKQTQAR